MPAKDIIHDIVKTALTKDGWIITHDPFYLFIEKLSLKIIVVSQQKQEVTRWIK